MRKEHHWTGSNDSGPQRLRADVAQKTGLMMGGGLAEALEEAQARQDIGLKPAFALPEIESPKTGMLKQLATLVKRKPNR